MLPKNTTLPTRETEIDWSIDVRYEPDVLVAFDKFIQKWCGSNAPHLLDTDEQDGEFMREKIEALLERESQVRESERHQIEENLDKEWGRFMTGLWGWASHYTGYWKQRPSATAPFYSENVIETVIKNMIRTGKTDSESLTIDDWVEKGKKFLGSLQVKKVEDILSEKNLSLADMVIDLTDDICIELGLDLDDNGMDTLRSYLKGRIKNISTVRKVKEKVRFIKKLHDGYFIDRHCMDLDDVLKLLEEV